MGTSERSERAGGVVDEHDARGSFGSARVFLQDHDRSAPAEGRLDVVMTVEAIAAKREEDVACFDGARIGRDAGGAVDFLEEEPTARRGEDLGQ